MQLKTSPEFERLTIPISEKEEEELAASLIREGCREPIVTWNDVILDGHKRFHICTTEHIEFQVQALKFGTKEEAVIWACRMRMEDLPNDTQCSRYLMGRWYNAKVAARRKSKSVWRPEGLSPREYRTSFQMGKEMGVQCGTLENRGAYARRLDLLTEKEPDLLNAVKIGDLTVSYAEAQRLSRTKEDQIAREIKNFILNNKHKKRRRYYIINEKKSVRKAPAQQVRLSVGIKDTPAFDPDMELQGLTLTVPTWIMVMEKAIKRSDMALVSEEAKTRLRTELMKLTERTETIMEVLL